MRHFFISALAVFSTLSLKAQFGPGILVSNDLQLNEGNHKLVSKDLDLDADLDIIIRYGTAIVWLENLDGEGTFAAADTLFQTDPMHGFDLADMDGDMDLDLVVAQGVQPEVIWMENQGDEQFSQLHLIDDGAGWSDIGALLCQDITGDGALDVLVTTDNNYVHWYVNDGGALAVTDSVQHLGGPPSHVLLCGDMNFDGFPDQVTINWSGFVAVALNNDGNGTTWTVEMVAVGFTQYEAGGATPQLIDVDGDGDLDLVDAQNNVRWVRNRLVEDGVWGGFDVVDVDLDYFNYGVGWAGPLGCGDYASILWQPWPWGGAVRWNIYDEQLGAFAPSVQLMDTIRSVHISAADVNGDGANDLIIADRDTSLIWWFPNLLPAANTSAIELTPFDTLCVYGDPYPLDHALPSGGTWSGEGVSSNTFTPPGEGSFTLTYQIVDPGSGCPMAAVQPISAVFAPEISLVSGSADECALDPLQYTASPSGGSWSGITEADGMVDRSCAARPASGEVTYAMNAVNGGDCTMTGDFLILQGCLFVNLGPNVTLCTNGDTIEVSVQGPAMGGAWLEGCDSILFTPPSSVQGFFYPDHEPGTYLISGSVVGANDCPGYDTLMVTVVAPPEPHIISQDLTFCANDPFGVVEADTLGDFGGVITAPETQSFVFPPDQLALGFHTFTFTVTDANGCTGSLEDSLEIVALPYVELITPVAVDIDGGSVTFNEGTPDGGMYEIDGIETATVDPINYAVGDSIEVIYLYTDPQTGCTGADTAYVLVEQITALNLDQAGTGLRVAPNPATGQCQLSFDATADSQIHLHDALGRQIRAWHGQRSPFVLDLDGLSTGNYRLVVKTNTGAHHCLLTVE